MRGRKTMPSRLKALKGNPSHRPLNEHEPEHAALDPNAAPPEDLADDPIAAAEWRRLVPTLSRGHLTVVDVSTFTEYSRCYARWVRAERAAQEAATPERIRVCNSTLNMLTRLAAECGLTPASRSRIVAIPPADGPGAPVDEFTAFQRARRQRPRGREPVRGGVRFTK